MAFNWNFKPKTINGFNPQPVESLAPQAPQPLNLQMKGMENIPANQPIENPLYQRAAYMDEYEADEARKAQELQAQQAGQEKRISDIQNEIAMLEKRIADNTAKLQKWVGPADQIAAIEARKINAQDPTSIWRWKVDRDAANALAREEKEKNNNLTNMNAIYEINNDLNSIIVDDKMTSQDQKAYLNKLSGLRTLAQKNGLPTEAIDAKIAEVKGETNSAGSNSNRDSKYSGKPTEQYDSEIDELLANPTMERIAKWKLDNPDWQKYASNEKIKELEAKHTGLIDANNKKNEARKFEQFLKDNGYPNGSTGMNPLVLGSMKRRWNEGKK